MYPSGTAERMIRIAQLREGTKQLDELAWRLWWEGFPVEIDLVRSFILKKAARWDEQNREVRVVASAAMPSDIPEDRDVLEEVFFEHLKVGPSLVSARKQLGRGSDIYIGFASLFLDLFQGDLARDRGNQSALLDWSLSPPDGGAGAIDEMSMGRAARLAMKGGIDDSYIHVVDSLDSLEITDARLVALRFLQIIASVGTIVDDVFGGSGRGRDNVGKSLIGLNDSPDEQVLSLLLTSQFLRDTRVRASLPPIEAVSVEAPVVTFRDFLRLRFIEIEVPDLSALIGEEQMRVAFGSSDGARRWRIRFDEFLLQHELELDDAKDRRPDLFGESPPPDDDEETTEEIVTAKKKNPK